MMEPWWSTTSAWTALLSLKAMTDAMNLDGPLEQTECLEDENSDFDQIKPLGYLGRKFGRFDLDGPLDRTGTSGI